MLASIISAVFASGFTDKSKITMPSSNDEDAPIKTETNETDAKASADDIVFVTPSTSPQKPSSQTPSISFSKLDTITFGLPLLTMCGPQQQARPSSKTGIPEHGTEAVVVTVANEEQFLIHKNLLCSSSTYFNAALTGPFKESSTNKLELKDQDPDAFKLFYHFLYHKTLPIRDSYGKRPLPWDIILLRTLKLAEAVMAYKFRFAVYEQLRQNFNDTFFRVPTQQFIFELYKTDIPLGSLREYVALHSAYWISHDKSKNGEWKEWQQLMDGNDVFMEEVSSRLIKMLSTDDTYVNRHPLLEPLLRPESVYTVSGKDGDKAKESTPSTSNTKISPMATASYSTASATAAAQAIARRKMAAVRRSVPSQAISSPADNSSSTTTPGAPPLTSSSSVDSGTAPVA